ncbi:MAG: putative er of the PurR regulon [Chlamydiales bacterium]|jgi:uncharacterized integral membrane protein (TIGR00697 family)|nr:putative er of the PurR regulon [Chlamydiales bacterium]
MSNEILFIIYIVITACGALGALRLGKEALIALICAQFILVNLFVIKQIQIFSLEATAAEALAVGTTLALNLLQEYYGRATTQKAIGLSFFIGFFYLFVAQLHLAYKPSPSDFSQSHFLTLLSPTPRLLIASLVVFFIVQQFDIRIYEFLRRRWNTNYYVLRNMLSAAATQLLDTILFTFLGLYGVLNHLFEIVIFSYIIKIFVIVVMTPFLALSKQKLFRSS